MSEALHPTRLEWDGAKGVARHDGVEVTLHHPPGRKWAEVHYAPGCQAQIRDEPHMPLREMLHEEIKAVQRFLAHMALSARRSIGEE